MSYPYEKLKVIVESIDNDPLNPMSDAEVLTAGYAKTVGIVKTANEIMELIHFANAWYDIVQAENHADLDTKKAAHTVVKLLENRDAVINYANPTTVQTINSVTNTLHGQNVIPTTLKDAIQALGLNQTSPFEAGGFAAGSVSEDHIREARVS